MTDFPAGVTEAMVERAVKELSRYDVLSGLVTDNQVRAALTAALAGRVVVPEEALRQARMMANICFNLSQSSALDNRARSSMKECQVSFDKAMYPGATAAPSPSHPPGEQG
jgi:hypothetical protein